MNQTIEISTEGICDYCDEPMKFAGADPKLKIVRRSCEEHLGMANVQLKADEWEARASDVS